MAYLDGAKLVIAVSGGDTELAVTPGTATALATAMGDDQWAFAEIYTALRTETVLVTAVDGNTLIVQRGMRGTSALSWPAGACVCDSTLVDKCEVEVVDGPTTFLQVSASFTWNADTSTLALAATGVAPGTYGGATVNAYGQFTSIPEGWPASALPVYDPCDCPPGSEGVATAADDVSYVPSLTACLVTATDVQAAIDQLDAAYCALSVSVEGGFGIMSLTEGDGIALTGDIISPVISLAPSGVAAGTYAGFGVDEYGRILGYTPGAVTYPGIATTTAGITVSHNGLPAPYGTYEINAGVASVATQGLAQLVDPANILSGAILPGELTHVVSGDGLLNALNGPYGAIYANTNGGCQVAGVNNRYISINFANLAAASAFDPATDYLTFYDASATGTRKYLAKDMRWGMGGSFASGRWVTSGSSLSASYGVSSVALIAAGHIRVTLPAASPSGNYIVTVCMVNGGGDWYVVQTSGTVFEIYWNPSAFGAAAPDIDFAVFAV